MSRLIRWHGVAQNRFGSFLPLTFFERVAVVSPYRWCPENFARNRAEEERIRGAERSNRVRAFGIKASRVIDWCSGGYTQRHVPTVASTDVADVCAWELLKAERIRQEKAAAVKKRNRTRVAIVRSVRDVTDSSPFGPPPRALFFWTERALVQGRPRLSS